jgi:ubiquinone/menaquinone biosynthesis C-methylase UbiE
MRPETIENRWDILYRDYPEVYEEFASVPYRGPGWVDIARRPFDFNGKVVADIGCGSGKSTFQLAPIAKTVIGIEPEDSMREIAIRVAREKKIENAEFRKGVAESLPLTDHCVDSVVAITLASLYSSDNIRAFVKEAERILRKGGFILTLNVAPRWDGGELAPVILGKSRTTDVDGEKIVDKTLRELSFRHKDYYQIQDYGSVGKIVRTYGFIFGMKAIAYLKEHNKTAIKWKCRLRYKKT